MRFGTNRAAMLALLGAVREEEARIREGGGLKAAEAQRAKGRLTVRERLGLLLDAPGSIGESTAPFARGTAEEWGTRVCVAGSSGRRGCWGFWSWGFGRGGGCMRSGAGLRGRGW